MRNWNFVPNHPITLTLAADARLSPTDYTNDQIWQLDLGHSDPPAIALETTFGLRARLCRIFPRFSLNGQVINDPAHFAHPITVQKYYPNYICLSFKPFSTINVKLEYWVPGSQVIAGRTKLSNTGREACSIELEWAELLLPSSEGSRMAVSEIGMTTLLAGKTSNLSPLLFLTGGALAGKSSYPSLTLSHILPPRGEEVTQWVHASLGVTDDSYELAKQVLNRNWDAEIARIARINSRMVDIYTGNQDWDTAFFLSQNIAYQLFVGPTRATKTHSIVTTRKPDQGFSLRTDSVDYDHLWNGPTLIDVSHLSNLILPASPELIRGLLDSFLDTQTPQGEIDWKPGLGGRRSHLLATPLLAAIAHQLYECTGDIEYTKGIYPKLLAFFQAWFSPDHDRDGDQYPEWDQAVQTGHEDLPLFSQHHPWSLGADITAVECPDLISYLAHECAALIALGKLVQNEEALDPLLTLSTTLQSLMDESWSDEHACYLYRDRDSHTSTPIESLGRINGPGVIDISQKFARPVRPIIRIETKREVTRPAQLFIHGTGATGAHRVEHISSQNIRWQLNTGFVTSKYTYSVIEHIEVNGVRPDDSVVIKTIDFTSSNLSLLLPLWSGMVPREKAKILINLTIMNKKKFLGPYGLRSSLDLSDKGEYPEGYLGVCHPWTDFVLDGLIRYGERKKAAELFVRMMKPVTQAIQRELKLYQSYHCETGKPQGAQNSLLSLVPIGIFLKILGVKIISPFKVELDGHNPFPWPVTIKYQGLTLVKQANKTLVIFPNGQSMTVDNDQYRLISCQ